MSLVEETFVVRPEKRFLDNTLTFTRDGVDAGALEVHALRPSRFHLDDVHLTFAREGLVVPRFSAIREDGRDMAVDLNLLTGGLTLLRGGARLRVRREGLLLPRLLVSEEGDGAEPVLVLDAEKLLGREWRATLRPSEKWPREDLLVALAALLYATVSVRWVWALAGRNPAFAPA